MSYTIFMGFLYWFKPYDFQNDSLAKILGQPVLGYPGLKILK